MTKTKLLFIGMALVLVTWVGASVASAQDGPSISLSPSSVAEAGEVEVTVTGSGWSVSSANVLTCNVAEDANIAEVDVSQNCTLASGNLNMGSMQSASVTDGGFEVTITVDVPAQGIIVVAGDSAQTESANALLTIAAADDSGDDMDDGDMNDGDDMDGDDMDDGDMDDGDMDDEAMDDGDMGDGDMDDGDMGDGDMGDGDMDDEAMDDGDMGDGDMGEDTMIPATGSNTPLLTIIALSVVLAGAMVLGLSRRLRTQ